MSEKVIPVILCGGTGARLCPASCETYPKQLFTFGGGQRYRVKRITVKPGGKLSLQSHMHLAEHWIVVTGTAHVAIGRASRSSTRTSPSTSRSARNTGRKTGAAFRSS